MERGKKKQDKRINKSKPCKVIRFSFQSRLDKSGQIPKAAISFLPLSFSFRLALGFRVFSAAGMTECFFSPLLDISLEKKTQTEEKPFIS